MEKLDEIHGNSGDFYMADYRGYDARLGRWLSTDPIVKPWESPYASFANNPIYFIDPSGLNAEGWIKGTDGKVYFDENVHSQEDVKEGEKYMGEKVSGYVTMDNGQKYHVTGTPEGNYEIYWFTTAKYVEDDGKNPAPAPSGGPAWARSTIQNWGDGPRYGQWGYTDPSANTIPQPTIFTNTISAGATFGPGLGTQYRTYSVDAPGYLYDQTSFSTYSFGLNVGGGSAGVMGYSGVGGMYGMGIWDQPSSIIMSSNPYNVSVGGTFIGGTMEVAPGQGYWLLEGGFGYNVGITSGYGLFDKNPFSYDGSGTWLTTPEAPRTRFDTLRVLDLNPNASDPYTNYVRNKYGR